VSANGPPKLSSADAASRNVIDVCTTANQEIASERTTVWRRVLATTIAKDTSGNAINTAGASCG